MSVMKLCNAKINGRIIEGDSLTSSHLIMESGDALSGCEVLGTRITGNPMVKDSVLFDCRIKPPSDDTPEWEDEPEIEGTILSGCEIFSRKFTNNVMRERDTAEKIGGRESLNDEVVPKVGEDIYVETRLHLSHGRDDTRGGLARVKRVFKSMSGGEMVWFVEVQEVPGAFNWEQHLSKKQESLKAQFESRRAHSDPDYRDAFNDE